MTAKLQGIKLYTSKSKMALLAFLAYNAKLRLLPKKFYGQSAEDAILQILLPEKNGVYIDIGCGNPIKTSNTFVFYKRGWKGVVVDPISLNQKLFRILRPKDKFILSVVGGKTPTTKFWEFRPYEYSTANQVLAEDLISTNRANLVDTKILPNLSMSDLNFPMSPQQPSLLCIDVESLDFEVLLSNDWDRILPRVICVEELNSSTKPDQIESFLKSVGYTKYAWLGISSIYLHKKLSREDLEF